MPDYSTVLEMTGLDESQYSYKDYENAVRIARAKAGDDGEAILPYVIKDQLIAKEINKRGKGRQDP